MRDELKKSEIIWIIGIILSLYLVVMGIFAIICFRGLIGETLFKSIIIIIMLSTIGLSGFIFLLFYTKPKRRWFLIALAFSIYIFCIGTFFIIYVVEKPNLDSRLWENGKITNYELNCHSPPSDLYKFDDNIYCDVKNQN